MKFFKKGRSIKADPSLPVVPRLPEPQLVSASALRARELGNSVILGPKSGNLYYINCFGAISGYCISIRRNNLGSGPEERDIQALTLKALIEADESCFLRVANSDRFL